MSDTGFIFLRTFSPPLGEPLIAFFDLLKKLGRNALFFSHRLEVGLVSGANDGFKPGRRDRIMNPRVPPFGIDGIDFMGGFITLAGGADLLGIRLGLLDRIAAMLRERISAPRD